VDEFLEVQNGMPRSGIGGWWEDVLPALDQAQTESLFAAARNRAISHRTIGTVLGRWGFEVSAAQVGHWRRNYVR
jgi:hypothetical protein